MRKMLFVIAAFSCCCLISACTLIPNFSEDHTNSNVPHKPTASPAATNIPIAVPTPAQKLCIQGDGVAESGLGQVSVSGQFSADEMASFINDVRDETQSLHAAMDKYGLFIPLDISIRGSDSGVRDIREYDYGKHHMIQALYSNVRLLFVFEKNLDRFNAQTVLICNDGGSISTAIEFQSISEDNWLILRYPSTVGSGYTSEQETWYSLKRKCVELSYYTRVSNYIYMNPMAVPHSWKVESSMRNGRVIIEGHFYIDNVEGAHLYDKAVSYVLEFDEQSKRFYVEEGIEDFMIWIPFLKQDALDALRD